MCTTCSNTCFNKNGHHKEYPTSVRPITDEYNGLFSESFITAHHLIAEYTGVLRTRTDYNEMVKRNPQAGGYAVTLLDYNLVIDARTKGSIARFANHSCAPNAELRPIQCGDTQKTYIRALVNIGIHEEITVDYDWEFNAKTHPLIHQCKCQATNCRGTIEKNPPQNSKPPTTQKKKKNTRTSTAAKGATANDTTTNSNNRRGDTTQEQGHSRTSASQAQHPRMEETRTVAPPTTTEPTDNRKQTQPTQHTFLQRMQASKREREPNQQQHARDTNQAETKKQRTSEYRPP
jgi:SET domain-containing protein